MSTDNQEPNIRQQILDAAEQRFRTYGLGKTTMAEIAEDSAMSAANLYRYFENKQDIAAECAWSCMKDGLDILRQAVREPAKDASEKLKKLVLETLRHVHNQTHEHHKINELVDNVLTRRPELIARKKEAMQSLIAEILAQGNNNGEFDIKDVVLTSRTIHHTLAYFEVPIFMRLHTLTEYEQYALDVVELLLQGLRKR